MKWMIRLAWEAWGWLRIDIRILTPAMCGTTPEPVTLSIRAVTDVRTRLLRLGHSWWMEEEDRMSEH